MTKPLRTRFVVADGSRAKWIERSKTTHDYVAILELKAESQRAGPPEGVVFEAASGRRDTPQPHTTAAQKSVRRFAREIADLINEQAAEGRLDRVALIAPSRLLSAIRDGLTTGAAAKVAGTLSKDLTKVPEHELGPWLRRFEI